MKIALLTTDSREHYHDYGNPTPFFGAAPEALIEGFKDLPNLEVHVISCLQRPVTSPPKLSDRIYYHGLHVPKAGWMRSFFLGCIHAVRGKLREIAPDIVHGQGTERECAMCAVHSGHPNVLTLHGNMAELGRRFKARLGSYVWLAARLEDWCLPRTEGVFCNSAHTESLVRPRARRVWPVPNALRTAFFGPPGSPPSCEPPVLLNVGVISTNKRQLELLRAAREWRSRGATFQLWFAGLNHPETAYGAAFEREVRRAEAEGWVRYLGLLGGREMLDYLDRVHAMIHIPLEEAFGLVVAEGLARNLKFFGDRTGGIIDIAEGQPGAELFDANDWEGLGNAVTRWVRQGCPRPTGLAEQMRRRYHPEVVARRHLEIYEAVLSNRS
jgi:glycosyltransferase involved in cell wall biosynthesis